MDAFIDGTWAELVEAEGVFAELISHLDQLAKRLPTRQAWDELVFLPPPAEPHTSHQSGHLAYIRGRMVDLGQVLPSLHFCINKQDWEFICMVQGLLFEGSMLAYDPSTNRAEWIPVQGSASDLSLAEEASAWELSNIMPHDPAEVMWRIDYFGEQRNEGSTEETAAETLLKGELVEEAMELGYQPDSDGEEDSDSTDNPHSPRHAMQHSSRHHHQSSVSWVD